MHPVVPPILFQYESAHWCMVEFLCLVTMLVSLNIFYLVTHWKWIEQGKIRQCSFHVGSFSDMITYTVPFVWMYRTPPLPVWINSLVYAWVVCTYYYILLREVLRALIFCNSFFPVAIYRTLWFSLHLLHVVTVWVPYCYMVELVCCCLTFRTPVTLFNPSIFVTIHNYVHLITRLNFIHLSGCPKSCSQPWHYLVLFL